MKYQLIKKIERNPHNFIYEIILTLILAFSILWIIYISVPYIPYRLYLIEPTEPIEKK